MNIKEKILAIFKPPRKFEQWDWTLLTKKEKRELENYVRGSIPIQHNKIEGEIAKYLRDFKKISRIHSLYDKLKTSEPERLFHWSSLRRMQSNMHSEYATGNKKRIVRDNKDIKNTSGGGGSNRIRYPSKKRSKRTWKNFYKLFPHLDPDRTQETEEEREKRIKTKLMHPDAKKIIKKN